MVYRSLYVNLSKTNLVIMPSDCKSNDSVSDDACQSQIERQVLWVTPDYRLTFNENINVSTSKGNATFGCFLENIQIVENKFKSIFFFSVIASIFKMCPLIWHFCNANDNNKPEKS